MATRPSSSRRSKRTDEPSRKSTANWHDSEAPLAADQRDAAKTEIARLQTQILADKYTSPVLNTRLALFLKALAILGVAVLVLVSWNEVPDDHAAEYHACLLLITAGVCLTGAAND